MQVTTITSLEITTKLQQLHDTTATSLEVGKPFYKSCRST